MNLIKLFATSLSVLGILVLSGCTYVGSFTPTELNTLHELSYQHCKELGGAKFVAVHTTHGVGKRYKESITFAGIVCNNDVEIRVPYPSTPE